MSNNGGPKHGGPHNKTHDYPVLITTDGFTVSITGNPGILHQKRAEDNVDRIQDGGSAAASKKHHVMDSLIGSSNSDSEDMATFETTIAGSNSEWIKTKLSNIGSIFNDSLDLADKVKEIDDLFTANSPAGDGMLVDSSVFAINPVLGEKKTHSSPCSPNFLEVPVTRARNYSDGEYHSTLNAQDRACLEEIEKGSQLSPEDEELLETRGRELQELEFQSLDKSNTLMTPQELEQMPDQGIEFEESVGPKINEADDSPGVTEKDGQPDFMQILITTQQGQQIFQISNSEIAKMGLTILQNPGTEGAGDNMELQASIQDGFLVIPVSLAEGGASLFQKSVTSVPSDAEDSNEVESEDVTSFFSEDGIGKVWQCMAPDCNRVFAKPSKLKIHYMRHTGERPFKCEAPGCDWAFTTAYQLKRHEECHQKKKDYVCEIDGCGRKFTTKYNLNAHYKLHKRPCTETCSVCAAKFSTIRQLDAHLKEHDNAPRSFKCPYEGCNKMFFSKLCMGSHARVHTETRDLTCKFEGCGRVFDKQCRLTQHMRSHTGEKPYVCTFQGCNWAFSTGSKLKRHERKHTGDRKYTCPIQGCGKQFLRAEHLKGHMVTHTGTKPFACTEPGCRARFTTKSSMHAHVRKHSEPGMKTYFCPIEGCNKRYNNKTGLRTHIAKHCQDFQAHAGALSLINPEFLAAGIEESSDLASENSNQSSSSLVTHDALNPADLINTELGKTSVEGITSFNMMLPNNIVAQLIVPSDGQMGMYDGQTSGVLDAELLAAAQASETKLTESKKTAFPEGGSARTDYHGNQVLSSKARHRQRLLREKIKAEGTSQQCQQLDDSLLDSGAPCVDAGSGTLADFTTPELLAGQGITFHDPETGAIYVQTQLLQDDPPSGDLYDDSMEAEDTGLTIPMLSSSTINLHDLE